MKVKNIMFFGFAAAILSAGAASAAVTHPTTTNYGADKTVADTDRKIVTSKAYVDTSTNKLAQDIRAINIPTATSDLTNDSGYITSADVPEPYDDTALAAKVEENKTAIATINASDPMTSGITATKVSQYDAYATNKQDKSDSTVANGTYNIITQGTGVGANLQALDTKIGAVPANSNVMAEIAAAQSAATYDDTALTARVSANETAIETINASDPMTSGITATKVSQYDAYATNKQDKSDSTVANGTYNIITQGTGVGANLQALDTRIGAVPANSNVMAEIAAAQSAATGAIHDGTLTVNSGRTGNAISSAYTANSENGATVTINDVPEKPNTCTDTNPCALVTDDTGNWIWLAMAQPAA